MTPNQENYYWLFSSSAQTISAFVAFLVTGFALVLNMMDSLQQKDETLEDIHYKLKSDHYQKIKWLAIVTGLAIIFSLAMVYINGEDCYWKGFLFGLTILLNLAAIILGILFVIAIINPERYKKAAQEIIKEDKIDFPDTGKTIDQTTFITEFIKLEKSVRDILQSKNLYVQFGDTPKMAYSFRQMVFALNQNELINRQTLDELMKVNKYRNLIFHGHQDKVDEGMLDRVRKLQSVINNIK